MKGFLISVPMWVKIIFSLVVALCLLWRYLSLSCKKIPPNKRGFVSFCGRLGGLHESGLVFVPWTPLGWWELILVPKRPLEATCLVEVITKGGIYGGIDYTSTEFAASERTGSIEIITRHGNYGGVHYASIEVSVSGSMRLEMPDDRESLVRFVEADMTKEGAERILISAIREAAAQMTWKQINEDANFRHEVENILSQPNSALILAGFQPSGIKVFIQVVKTPKAHIDAMTMREIAPIDAETDAIEASDALASIERNRMQAIIDQTGMTWAEVQALFKQSMNPNPNQSDHYSKFKEECYKLLDARAAKKASAVSSTASGQVNRGKGGKKRKPIKDMTDEEKEKEISEDD